VSVLLSCVFLEVGRQGVEKGRSHGFALIDEGSSMLDTREIHSLTDFLRNHKAHVTRLKKRYRIIFTYQGRRATCACVASLAWFP
jgi:hypothetical protein